MADFKQNPFAKRYAAKNAEREGLRRRGFASDREKNALSRALKKKTI